MKKYVVEIKTVFGLTIYQKIKARSKEKALKLVAAHNAIFMENIQLGTVTEIQ